MGNPEKMLLVAKTTEILGAGSTAGTDGLMQLKEVNGE